MSVYFMILLMLFFHIVDDYYLQGVLASMKQKSWWLKNAPSELYKYDYIIALIMHSISWTFMVMLPVAIMCNFNIGINYLVCFIINVVIHGLTDDAKANRGKLNLVADQFIHMVQICSIAILFICGWLV